MDFMKRVVLTMSRLNEKKNWIIYYIIDLIYYTHKLIKDYPNRGKIKSATSVVLAFYRVYFVFKS